jgi:hypothetical protein
VLGGALAVFALTLVTFAFPRFADAVSISQARRLAGFLPLPFAFAGGAVVLARTLWLAVLPAALAAGLVLQHAYSGDFGYVLDRGGPSWATWTAAVGGAAALLVGLALGRLRVERRGLLAGCAAILFVVPVAWHGFSHWTASPVRRPSPLTAGLLRQLRDRVPKGAVVFSDLETSYRIAAAAPVYVAAAPPGHVADTDANHPYRRRDDVRAFFRTGDLAIPRRYRAGWLVIDRSHFPLVVRLSPAYADPRYVLYRL